MPMKKSTKTLTFEHEYRTRISDTPIFDYSHCERTFFKRDVSCTKPSKILVNSTSFHITNTYIFKYCKKAIENDTIPKFAIPEQIRRNNATNTLTQLTELEERLVALRLPFLQIKEMGHRHKKPQLGLTGGVINVPTNISRIQSALP